MSLPQSEKGKPCDNCGDLGFTDFIAVCSQCNEACEHIYCMKEFHDEVPDNWVCEKCQSLYEPISPRSEVKTCKPTPSNNSDSPVKRSLAESSVKRSIPRDSPTGKCFSSKSSKVKFIPAEEAKLLSSGAMEKASRSRFGWSSRPKKATISSVLRRSAFLNDNLQKGISNTNSVISQPTTPHVMGLENVTLCPLPAKPSNPQHADASSGVECKSKNSVRLAELKSSSWVDLGRSISMQLVKGKQEEDEACRLRHVVAPAHVSPRKLSSQVDLEPTISKPVKNDEQAKDEACRLCPMVASAHILPRKLSSQVDPGPAISKLLIDRKQEEDKACRLCPAVAATHVPLRKLSPLSEEKLPNHPLPDALWEGNFEIVNSAYDHCLRFCYGIQAHRPVIVSSKACEVSKWMPNVLLLKLQPRCDIWPRIFLKDSPDANDIALYFFSDNCDRSRLNYIHLVEVMEHHDWAMTGYIDDAVHAELVVFTSKQLPVESQRLNMQIYLWGLFICKKDATSTPHSTVPSLCPHGCPMQGLEDGACGRECVTQSQIQISSATGEDCDMEIDMIGGKVVGRVDVPLPSLDSKNVMVSATHSNGHGASPDRNGLVEGSSMIKQEFPIPSSMSIEHDGLSFPSAPRDFSKPVRSEAAGKKVEKLRGSFGIKKSHDVRFTGVTSCFRTPSNIESGTCQSDRAKYMDGSSAVRSSEVQRSTNVTIPRCLPEITSNTAFSNEHQSSQAASRKQQFPSWSTKPRSKRVTKGIGSRGFLGSPILKNHAPQNPRCFVESYNLPLRTNPSNIKRDHQLPKAYDYRDVKPVGGSTKLQSSTESILPAVPPGFTKPGNLIDEYRLSRNAIREDKHAMVKIEVRGEPSRQFYGSPRTLDAKDDLHMPRTLNGGDEKHSASSCDVQSLSQPTFPRVAPGFINLINPNDESQPSRATIKIRKNITTHNSALNGDTEMVDAASSGELLGSRFPTLPRVPRGFTNLTNQNDESQPSRAAIKSSKPVLGSFKMHTSASKSASDNLIDQQKAQAAPLPSTGCSSLNLHPEVKVEIFGIHSPHEAAQKQGASQAQPLKAPLHERWKSLDRGITRGTAEARGSMEELQLKL